MSQEELELAGVVVQQVVAVVGLIVQSLAIVAALIAALIALYTSAADRRNNRLIASAARDDADRARADAVRRQQLATELEHAIRLSVNLNHGGSTDPLVRKQLGAEALALVALLGPERVPALWARKVAMDETALRAEMEKPETPQFQKDIIEASLAVQAVMRAYRAPTTERVDD
ncbi:hypothetical protein [Clavibacter nebraskensis]|uniref:hypothetical protein n=1 Tax=Clavibacter nebraskensis TaxID=31963 RepID=UPI003F86A515